MDAIMKQGGFYTLAFRDPGKAHSVILRGAGNAPQLPLDP